MTSTGKELRERFELWWATQHVPDIATPDDMAWIAYKAAHVEAQAEIESLRKDAERYRWLRNNVQPLLNESRSPYVVVKVSLGVWEDQKEHFFDLGVVTLNQAIDAAMAREVKP